jgi:integral membrane protein (TIGR00529 family)
MCLEYQLRTGGIIDGFMAAARKIFKSDKVLLALMPSFLGFLPSLGGAIFSAPLVEAAAKSYTVSPERKTEINYWFRHIWECTNPIIPALLLASEIAKVPIGQLTFNMLWTSVLCFTLGWLYYIAPLKKTLTQQMVPTESITTDNSLYIILAIGPIIANLLLVVGIGLSAATSMLLVVAVMTVVLKFSLTRITTMVRHAFDCKLLWGVINILFFQYMLTKTSIISEVANTLQSSGIPSMSVIGAVGFTAGLLTGTSQGAVAISFPLMAALAAGNSTAAVVAYVAGFGGQLLSPAHLSLLVTLDYFNADFFKTLCSIAVLVLLLLAALFIMTLT